MRNVGMLLLACVLAWPAVARPEAKGPGAAKMAQVSKAFSLYLPPGVWKKLGVTPHLTPGTWVSYQEAWPNANPSHMRVSVIPPFPARHDHRHILEFETTRPTGQRTWLKLLVTGNLDHPGDIERVMVAATGLPAMEVPILAGKVPGAKLKIKLGKRGSRFPRTDKVVVRTVGVEDVTVPAGTFHARHLKVYRQQGKHQVLVADLWLAPKVVPLWGMVRSVSADGRRLELEAKGTNARTDLPPFKPKKHPHRKQARPARAADGAAQGKGSESTK